LLPVEDEHDPEWRWGDVSRFFHLETSDIPTLEYDEKNWFQAYLNYCDEISPEEDQEERVFDIVLPDVTSDSLMCARFVDVANRRTTSRRFTKEHITLEDLSTLLQFSFGESVPFGDVPHAEFVGMRKRYPSAGGLHAQRFYFIALRVRDLEPGVYEYSPQVHALRHVRAMPGNKDILRSVSYQAFALDLSCMLFITTDLSKVWWKYPHSKGYRFVLLDVGHASQTFLLSSTAMGFSTWVSAALSETFLSEEILQITANEFPFICLGVGTGTPNPLSIEMEDCLV